jgi:hypothetical protein
LNATFDDESLRVRRLWLVTAVALALLAGVDLALAEDAPKDGPILTIRQALEINSALGQMNCEVKMLVDGAKQTSTCIPFPPDRLKVGLAWLIAKDQRKTATVAQDYQKRVNEFLATLPRKADGDLAPEANVKFLAYQAELLEKPAFLPGERLEHLKKSELEPLNLQPSVLSGLLPIIDE